jgi:hypothetical protein
MSYSGNSRLQSGCAKNLSSCWTCSQAIIGRNHTKPEYCYCEQLWTYYKLLLLPFWEEFVYIPYTVNLPEWYLHVAEADHYPLSTCICICKIYEAQSTSASSVQGYKKSQKMTLAIGEVFVVDLCTRKDDRNYIYAEKQLLCEVQIGTGTHGQ